jgi:general secretion pathway protein K
MLVLWVIVVLGAIGAGVAAAARGQTRLVETVRARTVARYAAESGVVATMALVNERLRGEETPEQQARLFGELEDVLGRWGQRELGAARYQVIVTDLNARVDLNNSAEVVLLGLLQQFAEEREAEALVNALYDWTDEDDEALRDGADVRDHVRPGSLFVPPKGPLLRLDELPRIPGFTDSIADLLAPYVTVWGDGQVNVNTAPLPVLAAVPEIGEVAAEALVESREQGGIMASSAAAYARLAEESPGAVAVQLRNITTRSRRVLVVSRGWEAGRPFTHEIQVVFELLVWGFTDEPRVRVLYWTERDL